MYEKIWERYIRSHGGIYDGVMQQNKVASFNITVKYDENETLLDAITSTAELGKYFKMVDEAEGKAGVLSALDAFFKSPEVKNLRFAADFSGKKSVEISISGSMRGEARSLISRIRIRDEKERDLRIRVTAKQIIAAVSCLKELVQNSFQTDEMPNEHGEEKPPVTYLRQVVDRKGFGHFRVIVVFHKFGSGYQAYSVKVNAPDRKGREAELDGKFSLVGADVSFKGVINET